MAEAYPATIGGQPVLILKEGTQRTRGKDAQRGNIMAAKVLAETIKTSLGPRGMDKMLVASFGDVTITNDGATILKEMDIQHPAAKMMAEVAKTQDDEVGDGTSSAVILAGELVGKAEELINKDIHPTVIVDGYRRAQEKALQVLTDIAVKVDPKDKETLRKVAAISMATKLVTESRDMLADIAVDAMLQVSQKTTEGFKADVEDVKVEKKPGESLAETKLIQGVVLDKEVVHSGMPKRVEEAKIALVNAALEVEKTEFDAKINIQNPEEMKAFLDEEEKMLRDMADKVAKSGANVLVCQKGIDDLTQHFLAKKNILAIRRASEKDMEKLSRATGAKSVMNLDDLRSEDLGYAKVVEERKIGDDKMTFIEGCKSPHAVAILIRGGTQRYIDEAERSLHDALCVVRDVIRDPRIVAGGGAVEVEIASQVRRWAESLSGKEQLAVLAFADALEGIPLALSENAGLDPLDIIVDLRARHEKGQKWTGVDAVEGKIKDMMKDNVIEPAAVKEQILKSASEAASMLLKIDDIIASGKGQAPPGGPPGGMPPGGEGGSEFD